MFGEVELTGISGKKYSFGGITPGKHGEKPKPGLCLYINYNPDTKERKYIYLRIFEDLDKAFPNTNIDDKLREHNPTSFLTSIFDSDEETKTACTDIISNPQIRIAVRE